MNRSDYSARRLLDLNALNAPWFWATLAAAVACGGAGNDDLLKPQGGGGQAGSPRGGSAGAATASGGVSGGGVGSIPGEQAGSDGDAGSAGASATGGSQSGGASGATTGGVGGTVTGGVGGKATTSGGVGGTVTGGVGGKATTSGGVGGTVTGGVGGKAMTGGAGGKATTGGVGGTASGGAGGKATIGGAGGKSTGGAGGASAGAGGAAATCPGECDANADCKLAAGAVTCTCRSGFVGNGRTCARPTSCLELHTAEPTLASGAYPLKPLRATRELTTYCEMTAEGGGWTLVLNDGPTFDPSTQGVATAQCYRQDCTNLAYSTVPVGTDVMLDIRDTSIVAANYLARVIVAGVEARTRGKTVRELFTGGPYYLEKQDNTNLTVRLTGARTCAEQLPSDFAAMVCNSCAAGTACDAPVIVFGDADPGCVDNPMFVFAIGGASTYTTPWGNCAGWPQDPKRGGISYYPNNFRVWVR